jgi:hypothetical protein
MKNIEIEWNWNENLLTFIELFNLLFHPVKVQKIYAKFC